MLCSLCILIIDHIKIKESKGLKVYLQLIDQLVNFFCLTFVILMKIIKIPFKINFNPLCDSSTMVFPIANCAGISGIVLPKISNQFTYEKRIADIRK